MQLIRDIWKLKHNIMLVIILPSSADSQPYYIALQVKFILSMSSHGLWHTHAVKTKHHSDGQSRV